MFGWFKKRQKSGFLPESQKRDLGNIRGELLLQAAMGAMSGFDDKTLLAIELAEELYQLDYEDLALGFFRDIHNGDQGFISNSAKLQESLKLPVDLLALYFLWKRCSEEEDKSALRDAFWESVKYRRVAGEQISDYILDDPENPYREELEEEY